MIIFQLYIAAVSIFVASNAVLNRFLKLNSPFILFSHQFTAHINRQRNFIRQDTSSNSSYFPLYIFNLFEISRRWISFGNSRDALKRTRKENKKKRPARSERKQLGWLSSCTESTDEKTFSSNTVVMVTFQTIRRNVVGGDGVVREYGCVSPPSTAALKTETRRQAT